MPCAIYHQMPAVYYLSARFGDDFESAVLHAVNGGGQNLSRAMLTGALVGAQVGLGGIPRRFIEGLKEGNAILSWRINWRRLQPQRIENIASDRPAVHCSGIFGSLKAGSLVGWFTNHANS